MGTMKQTNEEQIIGSAGLQHNPRKFGGMQATYCYKSYWQLARNERINLRCIRWSEKSILPI